MEVTASRPGRFTPKERTPVPKAGLDVVEKRKILPHRKSNPGRLARSLVTIPTDLPQLLILNVRDT
jgi:hypothetical protein